MQKDRILVLTLSYLLLTLKARKGHIWDRCLSLIYNLLALIKKKFSYMIFEDDELTNSNSNLNLFLNNNIVLSY